MPLYKVNGAKCVRKVCQSKWVNEWKHPGLIDHSDENNSLQVTHQFKEASLGGNSFNENTNDLLTGGSVTFSF